MGCCLFLYDGNNSVLLDTGLAGETIGIRRLFRRLRLPPQSLKAIVLTHGHLDHAGNLARLKAWSGAKIYAHPLEQAHIDGKFPYQGVNRWCGRLEALGRTATCYRPAPIDEFLADGQQLPFWGGLEGGEAKVIGYVYGGQGTMNVPSWSPDSRQIAFVSNTQMP